MKRGKREKGGIVAAKATILVVDDEANNRNVLVAQLGGDDYELLTAASGEEALALIEREEAQAARPAKRGVVAWVADRFRRQ